jgi:hypothetical protein
MVEASERTISKNVGNAETNKTLDRVASTLYDVLGMGVGDILVGVKGQLEYDRDKLSDIRNEMDSLRQQYNRYRDLSEQLDKREDSMNKLVALLGPKLNAIIGEVPLYNQIRQQNPQLELWEAVEQFLRFKSEARVNEILEFLKMVGRSTSRQAVEATINVHPKVFTVRKHKREKFISLRKGRVPL